MNTDIRGRRFYLQNLWLKLGHAEYFTQWQFIDMYVKRVF
jgi:hypothetical protein